MDGQKILTHLDTFLKYCVMTILILAFLIFLFVFIINWEDWFFGIKLDGLFAGIYLILKGVAAGTLFFLFLIKSRFTHWIAGLAVLYLGIIFIDSAFTTQKLTYGKSLFSYELSIVLLIALSFFIIHYLQTRIKS